MTGQESNPSSLFRLYVDYGRYTEATNLLLDCIESLASAVKFSFFSICKFINFILDQVFLQIVLEESPQTHYMATHKTIHVYYLNKLYDSLNRSSN